MIPPIGPTVPVKYGGKLVARDRGGARREPRGHARARPRTAAQPDRSAAPRRACSPTSRAPGLAGEELSDAEMRRRFERYAEEETAGAAVT